VVGGVRDAGCAVVGGVRGGGVRGGGVRNDQKPP